MLNFFENRARNILRKGEIPRHIAIIMDGNGTWAKRRGLPRTAGHAKGADSLRKTLKEAALLGIQHLSIYAFSTENWKRPKAEVDYLMELFMKSLQQETPELIKNKVELKFIGDTEKFSIELQKSIKESEENTLNKNRALRLNVMMNYGSRAEILHAVNDLCKTNKKNITEEEFSNSLFTKNIPDPDLLIRTSGQLRISNYLLWQIAYTELWFTNICWPDFNGRYLRKAVADYQKRHRRRGGL